MRATKQIVIFSLTFLVVASGCSAGSGQPLTTVAGCMPDRPNAMMQEFVRTSSAPMIVENYDENYSLHGVHEIFRDSVRTYPVTDGHLSRPITHVVSIKGEFVYPYKSSIYLHSGFEKYVFPLGVTYLISFKGRVSNGGYITQHCIVQLNEPVE